jgi:hypothetical protein
MRPNLFIAAALICLSALTITAARPQKRPVLKSRDLKGVVITLSRSTCFGSCPVYTLAVRGDGSVDYEGKEFVKVKGRRSYRISKESVRRLVDEFYRINYFSLENEYVSIKNPDGTETTVTDLPSCDTSITVGGRTKGVHDYVGAPSSLERLERTVDRIAGVAKYVGKR